MQADHFDHALTAFRQLVPFRPFTVALVNGDRFKVDHPGALVVRDGVAVFIGPGASRSCSTTRASASSSAT